MPFLTLSYGTGVPLARHVAGFPSLEDRINPDWSAQNAFRPYLSPLGAAVSWNLLAGWDPLESTCRHASLSIL